MKKRVYIITGIITYLVFLIASAPAEPILSQLQKQFPEVSMQGISGLLWNGSAQSITINRQHVLLDTDWDFDAWRLFTGEISARIHTQYQQQPVIADIGVDLSGKIIARNVITRMDAAKAAQLARIPFGKFDGDVTVHLSQLVWQPQQVPRATGELQWNNASITVAETVSLGNISITLDEGSSAPLSALIKNIGGQIRLDGNADVSEDGNYTLKLNMLPEKTANNNIRSSLGMFAKPQANGSYQLDNSGNLKQYGLI